MLYHHRISLTYFFSFCFLLIQFILQWICEVNQWWRWRTNISHTVHISTKRINNLWLTGNKCMVFRSFLLLHILYIICVYYFAKKPFYFVGELDDYVGRYILPAFLLTSNDYYSTFLLDELSCLIYIQNRLH